MPQNSNKAFRLNLMRAKVACLRARTPNAKWTDTIGRLGRAFLYTTLQFGHHQFDPNFPKQNIKQATQHTLTKYRTCCCCLFNTDCARGSMLSCHDALIAAILGGKTRLVPPPGLPNLCGIVGKESHSLQPSTRDKVIGSKVQAMQHPYGCELRISYLGGKVLQPGVHTGFHELSAGL